MTRLSVIDVVLCHAIALPHVCVHMDEVEKDQIGLPCAWQPASQEKDKHNVSNRDQPPLPRRVPHLGISSSAVANPRASVSDGHAYAIKML